MTIKDVKHGLVDCVSGLFFLYHNKKCGIDPNPDGNTFTFDLWCGNATAVCHSFDEAIMLPIFDGKSINELLANKEIIVDWG